MAPVDYRYLLVDSATGENVGELPLTPSAPFTRMLNGCGSFSGTVPLDHAMATYVNLQSGTTTILRELTILRNNAPVWNGPITGIGGSFSSRQVTLSAREASWWLSARVLEIDKTYTASDLFTIVRDLVTYMTTKTSNGTTGGSSINASIPRFSVSPASASAGVTKTLTLSGAARYVIADLINDFVADPTAGLDYRMDYSTGSTRQTCQRTLTFGSPSLGVTQTAVLIEQILTDFTKDMDFERAATRSHATGNGYTYAAQNTGNVTAGGPLIDRVFPVPSSVVTPAATQSFANDARRRAQPPVTTYTWSFDPNVGPLGYGWCDLGDSINMNIGGTTVLHSTGHLRVVQLDTMPPVGGGEEIVTGTFNVPLDQLGT